MSMFKGVIPAMITSFDKNGKLYINGIKEQIDYLSRHGIKNLFIGGSYGSFPLLSIDDRKLLIEVALMEAKNNNMKCIVQVGAPDTNTTVNLAKFSEKLGADAIASVVPYYYSGSILKEEDFIVFFDSLISSVHTPVHCYNNPRTTGFDICPEFLEKLINIGLKGIKDGSSDIERMYKMISISNNAKHEFDYIAGSTSLLFVSLLMGAKSCVSGVALASPKIISDFYDACVEHKVDEALELNKLSMEIRNILGENSPRAISCYDVLEEVGLNIGTCKPPWRRNNDKDKKYLINKLKEIGVI